MSTAFSAAPLDITGEKGRKRKGRNKRIKNKALCTPTWPRKNNDNEKGLQQHPPQPNTLSLCTLMYKIAWIHKQHYYIHCLPAQLPLFPFFPPTSITTATPSSFSHTNVRTLHFLPSHTRRHISPEALFLEMVNKGVGRKIAGHVQRRWAQ